MSVVTVFRLLIVLQAAVWPYQMLLAPDMADAQDFVSTMTGYGHIARADLDDPALLTFDLVCLVYIAAETVGLVLLCRLARAGRWLFGLATLLMVAVAVMMGVAVVHPLDGAVGLVVLMGRGALAAMMLTGDVAARFGRRPEQVVPTVAAATVA